MSIETISAQFDVSVSHFVRAERWINTYIWVWFEKYCIKKLRQYSKLD